jgi:hypothetical protein
MEALQLNVSSDGGHPDGLYRRLDRELEHNRTQQHDSDHDSDHDSAPGDDPGAHEWGAGVESITGPTSTARLRT